MVCNLSGVIGQCCTNIVINSIWDYQKWAIVPPPNAVHMSLGDRSGVNRWMKCAILMLKQIFDLYGFFFPFNINDGWHKKLNYKEVPAKDSQFPESIVQWAGKLLRRFSENERNVTAQWSLLLKFSVCQRIWIGLWVLWDGFKLSSSLWIWIKRRGRFCPLSAIFQTVIWFLSLLGGWLGIIAWIKYFFFLLFDSSVWLKTQRRKYLRP